MRRFLKTALTGGLAAILLGGLPAQAETLISRTQLRDAVAQAMQDARPGMCTQAVGENEIRYGVSQEECGMRLFVDNLYFSYRNTPAERAAQVADFVAFAVASLDTPHDMPVADLRERLVVVLRPLNYADGLVGADDLPAAFVMRPFAGDIGALLMVDYPDHLATAKPEDLEREGLDTDAAFALAADNLRTRMGPVDRETVDGLQIVSAGSALASGLLFLPESCGAGNEGELAYLFDREAYLLAQPGDSRALTALGQVRAGMLADGSALSGVILTCADGEWIARAQS